MSNSTPTYSYDDQTYSDLHKDAYGFRPRGEAFARWNAMTPAEKQVEWDRLIDVMEYEEREERNAQWKAMMIFEELVEKTIEAGAGDRETAVRWLFDAAEVDGDVDYFCWHNGLPYGYFGGSCGMVSMLRGY